MFGWSISASACRSASNRASTAFESIPALMSLTRDPPLDRLGLLGHPDRAHAALADLLRAACTGRQNESRLLREILGGEWPGVPGVGRIASEPAGCSRKPGSLAWASRASRRAGLGVAGAGRVEVGRPLGRGGEFHGVREDLALVHGMSPPDVNASSGGETPDDFSGFFHLPLQPGLGVGPIGLRRGLRNAGATVCRPPG